MPGFFAKLKAKLGNKKTKSKSTPQEEGTVSIQPHPAKTNDPADLNPPQPGGGLRHDGGMEAHHARDPHVPAPEIANNLPEPAGHDELRARQAELNK
ncbi:hypothetical protein BD626DRAFT_547474 [Schizophyllum amplum]|uniref:Uncharacterized protein n=1 Tax=Schizophyllum amplum TaxID=97359 RepID=A0A550CHP8_9AGAR|nr:hypothetical protein BD626DRAFT_547474 [Auriculariopsis ampla]